MLLFFVSIYVMLTFVSQSAKVKLGDNLIILFNDFLENYTVMMYTNINV